jgi:putative chitinase
MEELGDGSEFEFREDLGNRFLGDGHRYMGHDPIQLTGRFDYRQAG